MQSLVTAKAKQATKLILTCIIMSLSFWVVYELCRSVSSTSSAGPEQHQVESPDAPARFYSVIERQRILRNAGFYTGHIDGIRGPLTIAAEKKYALLYNDWCARQNNSQNGLGLE